MEFGLGYFDFNDWDSYYDRLMFPIYDLDGELVSFQARALFDFKAVGLPKYYHGKYDKSSIIYGLYHNAKLIVEKGYCVIVEGPFDVLVLWQLGIPAVACFGTSFSETQACILRMYTDTVVTWLDNDPAGIKGTEQLVQTLSKLMFNVYTSKTHSKDPSDLYTECGHKAVIEVITNAIR